MPTTPEDSRELRSTNRIVDPHRGATALSRRSWLLAATGVLAGCGQRPSGGGATAEPIELPKLLVPTEKEETKMPAPWPPEQRVGFAIVGLGRLSLEELLPAFGSCLKCKPTALVSGDRDKALRVAAQYGIAEKHVYDYASFDRLKDDPTVDVVFIVLPNSMHAEYTIRAAQAGKHVLCEKPMANTIEECDQMIAACAKANRKLMVAYRMQYEPHQREVIRMARAGELGTLKSFLSSNGQHQGDPNQWRLKKALAGGGALPDIGIYCLNAARYISGEEPIEVQAMMHSTPDDPRFKEVEEQVNFTLRFPSGLLASCSTAYATHDSKEFRLLGTLGSIDANPAYSYKGHQLRVSRKDGVTELKVPPKNQFALEMDHMAECVRNDRRPHTPGEEGRQDMRLMAAIYEAARSGGTVKLPPVPGLDAFRGPPPT